MGLGEEEPLGQLIRLNLQTNRHQRDNFLIQRRKFPLNEGYNGNIVYFKQNQKNIDYNFE